MHCQSGDIEDSLCGVITVPVVKINKMADSGAPRLRVNEVGFCSERKQMKWLGKPSPSHLITNPYVINRFIFGQGVVIYYRLN